MLQSKIVTLGKWENNLGNTEKYTAILKTFLYY